MTPVLIIDGDCEFCRNIATRWQPKWGHLFEIATAQTWGERLPPLDRASLLQAVHFIDDKGKVFRGAAAVFRAKAIHKSTLTWWCYRHSNLFRTISEHVYTWIANHRTLASRWLCACWKSQPPL